MYWSAIASTLHIYGIALMVAAFFMRTYHLSKPPENSRLEKSFFWDNVLLLVVLVVMGAGFWRMGLEKGTSYYLHNHAFWLKVGVLTLGWFLETPIMVRLIQWRIAIAKGETPDTSGIGLLRKLAWVEASLTIVIIFAASLMARGIG